MVLKWWSGNDKSFKHYELRRLKCPKHSNFYLHAVWAGRTLVQEILFGNYFVRNAANDGTF